MHTTIAPVRTLRGTLTVPGDKSIAHRALILGALARGTQVVTGLPGSADVQSTAACLRALGCRIEETPDGRTLVGGGPAPRPGAAGGGRPHGGASAGGPVPVGECGRLRAPDRPLDAGNSGTTTRLLAGLVAGLGLPCTIDGDESLRRRPMERIAEPLRRMGAGIQTSPGGCLPLRIHGGGLEGITYHPPVASAQVKSCLLIAGLGARGPTTVIEKLPTRDHTENLLEAMGVPVRREGLAVTIPGGSVLRPVAVTVPGDVSSAAFFLAAAAIVPGSEVKLLSVGINPTRTGALQVLRRMGVAIAESKARSVAGEPIADLTVRGGPLRGIDIGGEIIPTLIDELPVLTVVAALAEGTTTVTGAEELRHKESDRIQAIARNLRALGADITERRDGFTVRGPCRLRGGTVESFGDHRIAMALAVAGLVAEGGTRINGSEAVSISYPGFFADLDRVIQGSA